jgi:hypothetical protein
MARSSAVVWFGLFRLVSAVVDLISVWRLSGHEKDLEIVLLRQQLGILQRTRHRPPRISRSEKLTLAVLTTKLKQVSGRSTRQLGHILRLFKPECCAGIVISSVASGRSSARTAVDDHAPTRRSNNW